MKEKKKEYIALDYNIVYFDENDIITTSDLTTNPVDPGSGGGDFPFEGFE
ncbi:MAG: hypothetical protein HFH14_11150 [Lachnospiraceae bacterium]|nr:hypothetical protein [Lachnospiraceae bacterium]